jgi:SnoaL-like domain
MTNDMHELRLSPEAGTTTELDHLAQRVQVLEDKEALRGLLTRGWRALDVKDWDTWSSCWTEDAEFEFGPWGVTHGRAAIREAVIAAEDGYPAMQHHILNMHFEIDGDRATGIGYMWFVAVDDATEPGRHYDMGGPYEWEFTRTSQGWRMQRQKLAVAWTSGHDTLSNF